MAMHLLLNKRFSRTFLVAGVVVILLSVAGIWSTSPRLRATTNSSKNTYGLETWLGRKPSVDQDAEPEFYPFETTSAFFPVSMGDTEDDKKTTKEDLCASFPNYMTQRIQPVLKTGHFDVAGRLEAQLDSVSACFTDEELLIFSDLNDTVRGRTVIDVLADLPEAYRVDNPDFDAYGVMLEMRRNGTLAKDPEGARKSINGWRLDKYKFLPGIERAWAMRPGRDWYVFYETDTYVVWDNLFRFLSTLDPNKPQYIGSPSPGKMDDRDEKNPVKVMFANGGPGYVLSRAAIEKLLARKVGATGRFIEPPLSMQWLDLLRHDCCGDSVLGWTLWNAGVAVQGYWPLFNPHPLHAVPYSDLYWCQPVITMHKTTNGDMIKLWRWEHSRRQMKKPLLYQDLFKFHHPGTPLMLKDHDNGGWADFAPPADAKIDSFEACGKACEKSDRCLQYLWKGQEKQECIFFFQIRWGTPRKPGLENGEQPPVVMEEDGVTPKKEQPQPKQIKADYTSGWLTDRIEKWKEQRTCEVVQWVSPSIKRIY